MLQELLSELGLSPNEGKIYETLLDRGELSVGDIALHANIHRRNAYDALHRLLEKGLCFEVHTAQENIYAPVDPGKLREILAEKQKKLDALMPSLEKKYGSKAAEEEVFIYKGNEGLKNLWRDIVRVGEDWYTLGAKGGWFDPKVTSARDAFFREAKRKKLKTYFLLDQELLRKMPNFIKDYPVETDYRVLPKEYDTSSLVHIYGDYVVMYTNPVVLEMADDITFFVVHSKTIAESYRQWFHYMWSKSKK